MKPPVSLVAAVVAVLALPASTVSAAPVARHDWQYSNDARQVRMHDTEPTAADPFVHVKFKRYGGDGQRQVRIAERYKKPTTALDYSKAVKLRVGEKVVFTTERSLQCDPGTRPLQVDKQMRVKLPGKPWQEWVTWTSSTQFVLEC
jgi:hypothetical protein